MNPLRGEVPLILGEGDKALRFTLKLGINALCAAEAMLGKKSQAILDDLEDRFEGPSMDTVRVLIWAGLRKYHPEYSPLQVGDLMDEHGPSVFSVAVLNAMASAFGVAEDKEGANPPKPKRKKTGTG